jgi:hypothetical protein
MALRQTFPLSFLSPISFILMAIVQDEGSGGDFRLIEKRFILFKFPLLTLFRHAIENPSILGNLLQSIAIKAFLSSH